MLPTLSISTTSLRLLIRVKPLTKHPPQPRIVDVGHGRYALEFSVTTPPAGGQANEELIDRLTRFFDVRRAAARIQKGTTSRLKLVEIDGNPESLKATLLSQLQL